MNIASKTHPGTGDIHHTFRYDAHATREFIWCHVDFSHQQLVLFEPRAIRLIHLAIEGDFDCRGAIINRRNHHATTLTCQHAS